MSRLDIDREVVQINTCAIVQWLLSKIEEICIGFWRISLEKIHRQAPEWIARKISTKDGSNVNGVERNKQSFASTAKTDLNKFLMLHQLFKINYFNCSRFGMIHAWETNINFGIPVDPIQNRSFIRNYSISTITWRWNYISDIFIITISFHSIQINSLIK